MKQRKLAISIIALTGASIATAYAAAPPLYLNFSRPDISFQESRDFSILNVNAPFSITLVFDASITETQRAAFYAAKDAWERRISGYQAGISNSGITIYASSTAIDGAGGVLGRAGPTYLSSQAGFTLAIQGSMEFDSADMDAMETNGYLQAVVEHEMGHVLGIGTLWPDNQAYITGSFQYTGINGIDAWNAEFIAPSAPLSFVPVEDEGGEGTRDGHWDENAGGSGATDNQGRDLRHELMTGWIDLPVFFSDTTLYSLMDLGFTVTQPQVDLTISTNSGGKVIGSGVDCIGDCTVSFAADSSVQLEAIAEPNYYFAGWGGDCLGDETCNLALDTDKTISANFQLRPAPVIECNPVEISGAYTQDTIIQSEQDITVVTAGTTIAKHVRLTIESAGAIHFSKGFTSGKYAQIAAGTISGLRCGG